MDGKAVGVVRWLVVRVFWARRPTVRVVVLSRWGFPDGRRGTDGHSHEEGRELKGNLELSFLDCFVFARRKVKKKRMYKLISATIIAIS